MLFKTDDLPPWARRMWHVGLAAGGATVALVGVLTLLPSFLASGGIWWGVAVAAGCAFVVGFVNVAVVLAYLQHREIDDLRDHLSEGQSHQGAEEL